MESKETILANLARATGTEGYHRFSILFKTLLLTDGCEYLAEAAQCYWLFDIIGSVQKKLAGDEFQAWIFDGEVVTCTDGNEKVLYTQTIEYTDFPLDKIGIFVCTQPMGDVVYKIAMLPSEY